MRVQAAVPSLSNWFLSFMAGHLALDRSQVFLIKRKTAVTWCLQVGVWPLEVGEFWVLEKWAAWMHLRKMHLGAVESLLRVGGGRWGWFGEALSRRRYLIWVLEDIQEMCKKKKKKNVKSSAELMALELGAPDRSKHRHAVHILNPSCTTFTYF